MCNFYRNCKIFNERENNQNIFGQLPLQGTVDDFILDVCVLILPELGPESDGFRYK